MDNATAIERLKALGWLPATADATSPTFSMAAALIEYQQWAGLPETAALDEATIQDLQRPRFCGHPDRMVAAEIRRRTPAAWIWAGPALPTVPDATLRAAVQEAFDAWARALPMQAREARPGEFIDEIIRSVRIDGRNGVLADQVLPPASQQVMRLDSSELWNQAILLLNVLCHEIGHFWGLGHISTPNCLMNPTYNPRIATPQPGDIQAMRALGYSGPPALPPNPPPPTPTPVDPVLDQYIQTVYDAVTRQPIRSYGMRALPEIVR